MEYEFGSQITENDFDLETTVEELSEDDEIIEEELIEDEELNCLLTEQADLVRRLMKMRKDLRGILDAIDKLALRDKKKMCIWVLYGKRLKMRVKDMMQFLENEKFDKVYTITNLKFALKIKEEEIKAYF